MQNYLVLDRLLYKPVETVLCLNAMDNMAIGVSQYVISMMISQ